MNLNMRVARTPLRSRQRRAAVAAFAVVVTGALAPPQALALDPHRALTQYVLAVWRLEQGLPHNSVRALRQTRDGYLWLGTYGGLVRFDGVRFQVYDNRNSGLRDNEVRSLAEDAAGTLWVGTTAGGLHRFARGTLEPVENSGIEHRTINALAAAPDGALWVGTSDGLFLLRNGQAARHPDNALAHVYINDLTVVGETAWIASASGLFRVERDRTIQADVGKTEVWSVACDRTGKVWAGLRGRLLELRWEATAARVSVIRSFSLREDWGGVYGLIDDRDGNLWIGTYGGGLYRLAGDRLERFSVEHGFLDHRPWALFEDREGSLWVGTRAGLARLRDGAAVSWSTQEGLRADVVRSVMEDGDGTIWIGSERGLTELREGTLRHFIDPDGGDVPVWGIVRDRHDTLWIGTTAGLRPVLVDQGRLGPLVDRRPARSILFDRAGRAWIGTDRGVVVAEDGIRRGALRTVPGLEDIADQNIEALFEDRDGGIWIGTLTAGMRRWFEGRVEKPTLVGGAAIGVRTFHQDEAGVFYVGTVGAGLFVRRPGGPFRRITTREGLPDDAIWSILQQGDALWMSSDRGVFRLSRSRLLEFVDGRGASVGVERVIGTQDGMKSLECNGGGRPAGLIARDGRLWFPTSRGAVVIDPRELERAPVAAPVAIEEVVVDRHPRPPGERVVAPPGSRDIEIHYTGLSFVNSPRMRFRYRLDGYDPDWVEAGTRRVAYYGSVPPGSYEFRVEAANSEGPWSGRGARLALRVEPRVSEMVWFRAGVVLAFVAAASGWAGLRVRRQRVREDRLRHLVAERTAELEQANMQLADLVTRDDLTGIANYRGFRQTLEREWRRSQRAGESLSLLLCDIDDFKAYNDAHGHPAGDACLARIAQAIANVVRRGQDLAARYGGEEFAVVLPATTMEGARAVGASVRDTVAGLHVPHAHSRVANHVTISVGCATVAVQRTGEPQLDALIRKADRALYEAKRTGRDRVVSSDDSDVAVSVSE